MNKFLVKKMIFRLKLNNFIKIDKELNKELSKFKK